MKIVFCSNFFNHHQLPISQDLYNNKEIEYTFIATEKVPGDRLALGYKDMNNEYPFIVRAYENEKEQERAIKLCNECDVLIIGSAPESYIKKRIEQNKLTFRYNERIFKKGIWQIRNIKVLMALIKNHTIHSKKNIYMLCASAYTKFDFSLAGAYKNKCYKWGYFPETKLYDINKLIQKKEDNKVIEILWVARFIDWKHPELPVKLAKELKDKNYSFKIKMIGTGILEDEIKKIIKKYGLTEQIEVIGAVQSSEVRKYMEEANIFIGTSDRNEGWGAVINEAMNSGCAVVANKKIGAVPYLIINEKNGLTYSNTKEFINQVERLINNKKQREQLGYNAYRTIVDTWNSKRAAENLLKLIENLNSNNKEYVQEGPCSKA